ncbi:AAA family ATPase [Micromonospora sp. NPDC049836]|uniref:AAA family ATPase n=1 Tax=Micromonospora sp. NPDC049836 TaxID=3364274 RepID=UPI0037B5786C
MTDDQVVDAAIAAGFVDESSTTRAKLVRLSTVKRERIDWLWPGYIARGKLHVIDGDPGLGKSTATADLAARITTGKPWPDGQPGCTPAGVVLLSAEDGLGDTIRPRLEAAGADLERVVALTGITTCDPETGELYERMPSLPGDIPTIRAAIHQVRAALVIIDPLMAYLGGDVNSHRDQDVRRALAPLAKMGEDTGAAIKLIRHNNKGGGNNALYRGGGSIGIIGAARLGFTFARDPEDEHRVIVACTKANITAIPQSLAYHLVDSPEHGCARVEWHDGPVGYTAADLLAASHESADDRADRNDAAAWLRAYLLDNDGEAEALAVYKAGEKAGFTRDTLKRAKKRAGVKAEKGGFDAGWMWRFTDEESSEGSTKGAKSAPPETMLPSLPSVLPSEPGTPHRWWIGANRPEHPDCLACRAMRPGEPA